MDTITIVPKAKRSGMIMPLVATIVVFIFLIGIAMLKIGFGSRFIAARTSSEITARSAADAGLTMAMHLMNEMMYDGSGPLSASDVPLQNTRATFSYEVTPGPVRGFLIRSTGESDHQISRTVYAMTWATSFWSYAVAVEDTISFKSKIVVDVWDPDGTHPNFTPTIATTSTEPGAVELFPNTELPGDVVVGPGGDPESVVQIKSSSVINGDTYAADTAIEFPDVTLPEGLIPDIWPEDPCSPVVIDGARRAYYSPIELKNGETLRIVGDVVMYVAGNMLLYNGARLDIAANSSLALYLGGSFIADHGAEVKNDTLDATKLRMYGTETCKSIILRNETEFWGAIYAPYADLVIHNDGVTYGSFIGKSFEMKNSAEFYYDARLLDIDPTSEPFFFRIERWWERGDDSI